VELAAVKGDGPPDPRALQPALPFGLRWSFGRLRRPQIGLAFELTRFFFQLLCGANQSFSISFCRERPRKAASSGCHVPLLLSFR
jgi:hypothetical protein